MIDPSRETLLSTDAAVTWLLEKTGHAYCRMTVMRWMKRGMRGIVLGSCKIGNRKFTSVEALVRFSIALTEEGSIPLVIEGPVRDRVRAQEAVQDELERIFSGGRDEGTTS